MKTIERHFSIYQVKYNVCSCWVHFDYKMLMIPHNQSTVNKLNESTYPLALCCNIIRPGLDFSKKT